MDGFNKTFNKRVKSSSNLGLIFFANGERIEILNHHKQNNALLQQKARNQFKQKW